MSPVGGDHGRKPSPPPRNPGKRGTPPTPPHTSSGKGACDMTVPAMAFLVLRLLLSALVGRVRR